MSIDHRRFSSVAAVACIAIGLAAVTAVLTLIQATVLRPLPFPEPDRLVRVWAAQRDGDQRMDLSIPEIGEIAQHARSFDAFAGTARMRIVARLPAGAERLRGEAVTARYFELIGQTAAHGRVFAPDEFATSAAPVALISHGVWQQRFGGAADIVGRSLATSDAEYRIVGVMPPGFDGTIEADEVEFWVPLAQYRPTALATSRDVRQTWTIARLRDGVARAAAEAEIAALAERWRAEFPQAYAGLQFRVEPFGENWRGPLRKSLPLLLGSAGVLLAIALANVASLMLARAFDRRRELAVRSALGANRRRLARELLWSTAKLVVLGGIGGALLAQPLLSLFLGADGLGASPRDLPHYIDVHFDPGTFALTAAVLGISALIAGTLPAIWGSRLDPASALGAQARGSSVGPRERRIGNVLVAGEIALTMVLLTVGALLLRSFVALGNVPLGFSPDHLLRLAITVSERDVARADLPAFYARLAETIGAQDGVASVGLVYPTLPPWDGSRPEIHHPALGTEAGRGIPVGGHAIDARLLDTLGIPLVAGRAFDSGDERSDARVALISAGLAERLGGVDRAIGTSIDMAIDGDRTGTNGAYRVVGVVGNVAWDGVAEQDTRRYIDYDDESDQRAGRLDVFVPVATRITPTMSIAVRTRGDPAAMIDPLRRAIATLAPASATHWISTMDDELAGEYAASRFYLLLVSAFSLGALLLAAVGLFAVLFHRVLQRSRELGVRAALGASRMRIATTVIADGARVAAAGVACGTIAAIAAGHGLANQLYGTVPLDLPSFALAAALVGIVALVAMGIPARRAARIDPIIALRQD